MYIMLQQASVSDGGLFYVHEPVSSEFLSPSDFS